MLQAFKPTTPSRRHTVRVVHSETTSNELPKHLVVAHPYYAGRNNQGRVTIRGRGGRVKRQYRIIDFKREIRNVPAVVKEIQFDPNRTCYIALVYYMDGRKSYILATRDMVVGTTVIASENAPITTGNAVMLKNIPSGTMVSNVELSATRGGSLVRSAGTFATVMGQSGEYTQIKLPSGEIRLIKSVNFATIGQLSNPEKMNEKLGKAGTNFLKGRRSIMRGVATNPQYHPHGGGQGKSGRHGTGGNAVDKWGNKRFVKTRNNPTTDRFILQTRKGRKLVKNLSI